MTNTFSRRSLVRMLAGTSAALGLDTPVSRASQSIASERNMVPRAFPRGFLWGSATASYQVEGAVQADGRGPSIWDTFSHTKGKVGGGGTGDVAVDFFHHFASDIALMKTMGLKIFRFSVAWTRIFPTGVGKPNLRGLDFYHRMLDSLLAAEIQPYCTLYHWDLPQPLQDRGGWENQDTAKAFADYAGYTAGKLGDRVQHFMTMNEMRTFVELGYKLGTHAPGLKLSKKRVAQLTHTVALGHGMAVQAIRASTPINTKVGIAENITPTAPVIESPEHIEAARKAIREENAMYLTVLMEGRYTDLYLKRLGASAPHFTPEEMKTIGSPMDFLGLNIYQPTYVTVDNSEAGYKVIPPPASFPHMLSSWLTIGPEALYWGPKLVAETWKVKEIYITENGASSDDRIASDGNICDTDRIMYLRNYIAQLQRAVSEGVPVKGYFLWSLLDNFEWADGFGRRFGIVYVDFKTQERIPKLSAAFYQKVIQSNAVC